MIATTESNYSLWSSSYCLGFSRQQTMPGEPNFVITFTAPHLTDMTHWCVTVITLSNENKKSPPQCLVSPYSLWPGIGSKTMSRTHGWFTGDSIYSVYAKVDIVAINRIKDGDNKPPPSNSPKIICPFSRYQVAASSCHCMEGKENRCQSCTSSTLPQWLFVGFALLPPDNPRQPIQWCHVALPLCGLLTKQPCHLHLIDMHS